MKTLIVILVLFVIVVTFALTMIVLIRKFVKDMDKLFESMDFEIEN